MTKKNYSLITSDEIQRKFLSHRKRSNTKGPDVVWNLVSNALSKDFKCEFITPGKMQKNLSTNSQNILILKWLRTDDLLIRFIRANSGKKITLGPNVELASGPLMQFLNLNPNLYSKVIFPSKWISDIYKYQINGNNLKVITWPVGINTEYWKPLMKNIKKREKIMVYIKEYEQFSNFIKKYGNCFDNNFIFVRYGEYKPKEFRRLLNKCKLAIWFSGTESQGIAMLEAWSMDVPTLVFKSQGVNIFNNNFIGESAPYLNDKCGQYFEDLETLLNLIQSHSLYKNIYEPRKWTTKNLTIELAIKKLIEFI